ncbi:hypothetical protein AB0F25_17135 [Streptomyces wedmorensis]|uniref:hypothetical protein n=1 Tax=Streptomyces wedmorensis TaxID=43759 RepID=UPI003423C21F
MPTVDAVAACAGAWIGRAALDATLRAHDGRRVVPPHSWPVHSDRLGPVTGLPAALRLRPDRAGPLASSEPDVAEGDSLLGALRLAAAATRDELPWARRAATAPSHSVARRGPLGRLDPHPRVRV